MNVPVSFDDLLATAPLSIAVGTALLVLIVEALKDRTEGLNFWLSFTGLVLALASAFSSITTSGLAYGGLMKTGGSAAYFEVVFCTAGALSVMLSKQYLRTHGIEHGEFYCLVLLAVSGMMLMGAATDLVVFFIGLELMSLCFYILAAFARKRATSNEAGLKYFLLGAFATGFLLYGIALVYGATGTTAIGAIVAAAGTVLENPLFLIGLALLLIGLGFKVALVPFHMWAPDVYEGAPTPVSGFMATGGKAAAFAVFLLLFAPAVVGGVAPLREVLAVLAALSMIVGNVIALSQNNIKRMLAYSSIAHAGYILTGIVAANVTGSTGVLYYLLAYTVMNIGAFGVVGVLESKDGNHVTYDEYAGLSSSKPILAGLMSVFMFSLAGIPPFAGFFGKYYVFAGAIAGGYTWLAIVGVLMSVVSAYYYLRLVVVMYFRDEGASIAVPIPALALVALVLSAAGVLAIGIFPSAVVSLTESFF